LNAVVLAWLLLHHSNTTTVFESPSSQSGVERVETHSTPEKPERALRQFIWTQIESTNYSEYIANLRSIGCPERTVRDIVTADVAATLRGLAATGLSTKTAAEWQEDSERLVTELMSESADHSAPISERVAAGSRDPNEAGSYRPSGFVRVELSPGLDVTESSVPGVDSADSPQDAEAKAAQSSANAFVPSPEIARRRWIATYITTRYGQQAWHGFEQDSTVFGGDIEALMQHLNIPIPEEPRRLQPVSR
jgi:hypothetical protein